MTYRKALLSITIKWEIVIWSILSLTLITHATSWAFGPITEMIDGCLGHNFFIYVP